MARPCSYPRELRERAVRLVLETAGECDSEFAAIVSISGNWGSARRKHCVNGFGGLKLMPGSALV
jgi:hypothetical protein